MEEEWAGARSSKFLPTRMHVQPMESTNPPHPLFNQRGKKQYAETKVGHFSRVHEMGQHGDSNLDPGRTLRKVGIAPSENQMDNRQFKKIVANYYTMVKPKAERVFFLESNPRKKEKMTGAMIEKMEAEQAVRDLDQWEEKVLQPTLTFKS